MTDPTPPPDGRMIGVLLDPYNQRGRLLTLVEAEAVAHAEAVNRASREYPGVTLRLELVTADLASNTAAYGPQAWRFTFRLRHPVP